MDDQKLSPSRRAYDVGMRALVWLCAGAGAVYLAVSWASPAGPDGSGNKKRLARRWGWALGGFVLIAAWLLCLAWGRRLSAWDDLSHWGLAVKNMITLDRHHCVPPSTTTFRAYPRPAACLSTSSPGLPGRSGRRPPCSGWTC